MYTCKCISSQQHQPTDDVVTAGRITLGPMERFIIYSTAKMAVAENDSFLLSGCHYMCTNQ